MPTQTPSLAARLLAGARRLTSGAPSDADVAQAILDLRDEARAIRQTLEAVAIIYAKSTGVILEDAQMDRPGPSTPAALDADAQLRYDNLVLNSQTDLDYAVAEQAAEEELRLGRESSPDDLARIRARLSEGHGVSFAP